MPGSETIFADSIAGQVIKRAMSHGRLAHALLLHGAGNDSLETFARDLSARLLGLDPAWAARGSGHPDYNTLRPSGKIRQIRIGEKAEEENTMRFFIRQLAQSPLSGDRKVGVVFEADRMNASSANAFLKTLEEPSLNTTILLLTSRPYSLLPTIRSRCLNFRLPADISKIDDPAQDAWFTDYADWLRGLGSSTGDKSAASRSVLTVYALVARFSRWIDDAAKVALAKLKESGALENLDDDEVNAVRSSATVSVRHRFFARIEETTCALAREISPGTPALAASVKELERATGLLRVNFNENAALELFLLATLRAWARRE